MIQRPRKPGAQKELPASREPAFKPRELRPEGEGRIPPQAIDFEKRVLGALLNSPDAAAKVAEILRPEMFYAPRHQKLFRAMVKLHADERPIDGVTIIEELRRMNELNLAEDPAYIVELTMEVTGAYGVEYHARVVIEKFMARNMITVCHEYASRAFADAEDVYAMMDEAENAIASINAARKEDKEPAHVKEGIHRAMDIIEDMAKRKTELLGTATGFRELDHYLSGIQKKKLSVIAGRPGSGKTAFMLELNRRMAKKQGELIQSIEMTEEELLIRLVAAEAQVNYTMLQIGRLTPEEWKRIRDAAGRIATWPLYIDDSTNVSLSDFVRKVRLFKRKHNIQMASLDYLQLMQMPETRGDNDTKAIGIITRKLKLVAKETDIALILLSQLNRDAEKRKEGYYRPILADLRQSGAIEQDADLVLFTHRPEEYGIQMIDGFSTTDMAEIIIGKQRNGPKGIIRLNYIKTEQRFENYGEPSNEQQQLSF